ncbi:Protein-lysine N-methyltransferase rrg1 [Elsinoe australis]|uniref:Protein-lysine N-methyltransferase rrg1 n=1 Tax=Elsinoe australis TaxID=40998 RepID=A0A2P8A054_9PEZI|nr:Protein-lysine N-methyltransferase rrg1 [Elsinoe australis]
MPFKHQMERQLTREDLGVDTLEDEPLHVYDLPQIHTKPSAKSLLDTLSLLSVESRSWEVTPPRTPGRGTPRGTSGANTPARQPKRKVRADGVPQYLTKIVSSRLAWIDDDADKEQIWDTASVRLSERSGRTAMGALTRAFPVPLIHDGETGDVAGPASDGSDEDSPQVDISIHEPALTADNLGFKTWAASYVLARNWRNLLHNVPSIELCQYQKHKQPDLMLELGAGTGLVGLAAAAVLGVRILLTDLPLISSNLARNVKDNAASIKVAGAEASVAVLDWSQPEDVLPVQLDDVNDHKEFSHATVKTEQGLDAIVVVAADPIYSMEHPILLVNAIKRHLTRRPEARVIIGIPIREAYVEERALFRKQMVIIGLELAFEEKEIGLDDWGSDDAPNEVECSTTVWKWA